MSEKEEQARDIILGTGAMAYTAAAAIEFDAASQILKAILTDDKKYIDESGPDMAQKRNLVMSAVAEKPSFQALEDLYHATCAFIDSADDAWSESVNVDYVVVAYGAIRMANAMLSAFVERDSGPGDGYMTVLQLVSQFIRNSDGDETVEILKRASATGHDIAGHGKEES